MTPAQLSDAVLRAARQAVACDAPGVSGVPGARDAAVPAEAGLRRPPHGDAQWATGLALRLAGPVGRPAQELAARLSAGIREVPGVRDVAVAPPGFVNIWLTEPALADAAVLGEIAATPTPDPLPEDPARDIRNWAAATGRTTDAGLLAQRESNPLFRVRYAHARTRALLRGGAALGLEPEPAGAHLLVHVTERAVLAQLAEWSAGPDGGGAAVGRPADHAVPDVTSETGRSEPLTHPVTGGDGPASPAGRERARHRQVVTLADTFLRTTTTTTALPLGPEKPGAVHRARLALAQATGTVLADGLYRLGVGAPDHA